MSIQVIRVRAHETNYLPATLLKLQQTQGALKSHDRLKQQTPMMRAVVSIREVQSSSIFNAETSLFS